MIHLSPHRSLNRLAKAKNLDQLTNTMETVSVHKAKATLSGLIAAVEERGERVVVCRYGKPVAEIVPYRQRKRSRPDPKLSRIAYTGDLTAPTVEEWEHA